MYFLLKYTNPRPGVNVYRMYMDDYHNKEDFEEDSTEETNLDTEEDDDFENTKEDEEGY